jgi:hypothetical protein
MTPLTLPWSFSTVNDTATLLIQFDGGPFNVEPGQWTGYASVALRIG